MKMPLQHTTNDICYRQLYIQFFTISQKTRARREEPENAIAPKPAGVM